MMDSTSIILSSPPSNNLVMSPFFGKLVSSPPLYSPSNPMVVSPVRNSRKRLFETKSVEASGILPQKRGRPPYHKIYPAMVPTIMDIMIESGFSAHEKRSEQWGTVGLSARAIRDELMKRLHFPNLANPISVGVVARLMTPPNRSHLYSRHYLDLIPAKVGRRENDISANGPDSHFCKAAVNYALEAGTCFEDETQLWSCDDKNKLLLGKGNPCVSRYLNFKTFFMDGDFPRYKDHDWSSGYKLIPSGYLRLLPQRSRTCRPRRARSASPPRHRSCNSPSTAPSVEEPVGQAGSKSRFVEDRQGRLHWRYPRNGRLSIFLRGNKFFSATAYNHYDDTVQLVKNVVHTEGKTAVVMVTDNGPDWRKISLKVLMCMGRLWRDADLDYLCVTAYNSGDSRFNMIERYWAPVTMWLNGLILSPILPGEDATPEEQSGLSARKKTKKNAAVLERAMDRVQRCLAGKKHGGYEVDTVCIPSTAKHVYDDESVIEELTNASKRKLRGSAILAEKVEEYQFLSSHATQRRFQLEFLKCTDEECPHCSTRPVRATNLVALLRAFGGCLPTPRPSRA